MPEDPKVDPRYGQRTSTKDNDGRENIPDLLVANRTAPGIVLFSTAERKVSSRVEGIVVKDGGDECKQMQTLLDLASFMSVWLAVEGCRLLKSTRGC